MSRKDPGMLCILNNNLLEDFLFDWVDLHGHPETDFHKGQLVEAAIIKWRAISFHTISDAAKALEVHWADSTSHDMLIKKVVYRWVSRLIEHRNGMNIGDEIRLKEPHRPVDWWDLVSRKVVGEKQGINHERVLRIEETRQAWIVADRLEKSGRPKGCE